MPGVLRQSTASQSRALGPFLDSTDFLTPKTGLTIANTDIQLIVNGGASANKNSGGGTHRANGVYGITFDATDTATVGELEVSVVVAGALPVFDKWTVVEEAVYDALYAAAAAGWASASDVTAIKAKTDNLPSDPADDSDIDAQLATIAGYIDTEVAAIKAKTDLIPAAPAAVGDIPTATQNADALLKRDWTSVSGEASRSVLNALRWLRNKWNIDRGTHTLTVTKEDDSTTAWTAAVTETTGDAITGGDPT
jgi:hypothetical protein